MKNKIVTHFYVKESWKDKNGEAPIYLEITVNGERAEISTIRKVDPVLCNIMAQKVNLDTLNIGQLNQYKEKAVKMIFTGGILTYVGAGVTVTGGALLIQFIIKDARDKNPYTDQTPANIYTAITTCGFVSIATGIPLMAIGSNKKERIEIALKKFAIKTDNSMGVGLGIKIRF